MAAEAAGAALAAAGAPHPIPAPPEALPAPYGRRIVRRLVGRLVTRWNQVLDFAERLLHLQRDIRRAHYELKTLQLSPTELSSLAQWHSGSDSIRAVCGILSVLQDVSRKMSQTNRVTGCRMVEWVSCGVGAGVLNSVHDARIMILAL